MKLALVVEPNARRDLRLRNAPREERACEADAPMGHVCVRWQADLVAEGTREAELVESRVRGKLVEGNCLREARVEQLARSCYRAGPRATRTGRLSTRSRELAKGQQRVAGRTLELRRRGVSAKQQAMQRRQWCNARIARMERVFLRRRQRAIQRRARVVDDARVEKDDLKPSLSVAGVLGKDLTGNLHVDRARTARPALASERPLGPAAEVQRGGVAVRHACEQMPVTPELPDRDAGECRRAGERDPVAPSLCCREIH